MLNRRMASLEPHQVEELLQRAIERASEAGIAIARRRAGAIVGPVVSGMAASIERVHDSRGKGPAAFMRPYPWEPLSKRASELPGISSAIPFVDRELQDRNELAPLAAVSIRSVRREMPTSRRQGGIGGARWGLAAAGVDSGRLARPAGWAAIARRHVLAGTQRAHEADAPLEALIGDLAAAHPGVPVVVDMLEWPVRAGE